MSQSPKATAICPLGEEPSVAMMTPRSLAKSQAELDALRNRVQELEQMLSRQEEASTSVNDPLRGALPTAATRLPPLTSTSKPEGTQSSVELPLAGHEVGLQPSERTTSAPESSRRPIPLSLSPAKEKMKSHSDQTPRANLSVEASESITSTDVNASSKSPSSTQSQSQFSPLKSDNSANTTLALNSPTQEDAKIFLSGSGEGVLAFSQRNKLYGILKRISLQIELKEDKLLTIKRLIDAECGDIIKLLLQLEREHNVEVLHKSIDDYMKIGSPSRLSSAFYPSTNSLNAHPVWGINYPLQKVARNLEIMRGAPVNTQVIVLVSSGAYNPIHLLHLRAFYVARQHVEANYRFPVVGAFISPSHDTYVRIKNRRNPREMISRRHRLGMIEAAVESSSWIEADKWEITRRRVLDYLSTLQHVREMCESQFPDFRFRLLYVCGCNTVVKLSHSALKEEGFGCVCVCRPSQVEMVHRHLGAKLCKEVMVVEDSGVLPFDLERATSLRVRQALIAGQNAQLISMVGQQVMDYIKQHSIAEKVAGKEKWSNEDRQWRTCDLPYVEYFES